MSRTQLRQQDELATEQERISYEALARQIAGKGDYEKIQRELTNSGLLEREKYRVQKEYDRVFSGFIDLNDRVLEMFTILDLYHKGTAEHCAETYLRAKAKIEKRLASGFVLGALFNQEFVSTNEFLRACLLHDIGKVEIPRFIISHTMNDDVMNIFLRGLVLDDRDPDIIARIEETVGKQASVVSAEELDAYLKEHHLRSVHFVPARIVLSLAELEELEVRGIDKEMSLMDIIRSHEDLSRAILARVGLPVESELAGLHHNYRGLGPRYPLAEGSLHISVDIEELLHIADVEQALLEVRGYKKGFSIPRVLRIIMEEVESGRIPKEAAYLWVDDEMYEFKRKVGEGELSESDTRDLRFVQDKLEEIRVVLNSA